MNIISTFGPLFPETCRRLVRCWFLISNSFFSFLLRCPIVSLSLSLSLAVSILRSFGLSVTKIKCDRFFFFLCYSGPAHPSATGGGGLYGLVFYLLFFLFFHLLSFDVKSWVRIHFWLEHLRLSKLWLRLSLKSRPFSSFFFIKRMLLKGKKMG